MTKVLLVVLVALAVYWIVKAYVRGSASDSRDSAAGPDRIENMVRCAHCGVHLPVSESTEDQGRHYCSEEHRRLHAD